MGLNAFSSRVGGLVISVIPVVVGLSDFRFVTLGVAVAAAVAAGVALALPETRGKDLEDRPKEEEGDEEEGDEEEGEEEKVKKKDGEVRARNDKVEEDKEEARRSRNGAAVIVKDGGLFHLS